MLKGFNKAFASQTCHWLKPFRSTPSSGIYSYRTRSKLCDTNFFRQWSPSMAYWLGVLHADGCVWKSKNGRFAVKLQMKCSDHEHVVKFRSALQSTFAIGIHATRSTYSCASATTIFSNELAQDLISLGCTPRKSLTLQWPDSIPQQHLRHFVRGYFDGDGCLHFRKHSGDISVSFCCSDLFIPRLRSIIKTECFMNCNVNGYMQKRNNVSHLDYSGSHSPILVLDWMYKDSHKDIRLERKYELYLLMKEIYPLKPEVRRERFREFSDSAKWKRYQSCAVMDKCPHLFGERDKKVSELVSKIEQIDVKTGKVIQLWDSCNAALAHLPEKAQAGAIRAVCRGKKRKAYGYRWNFHAEHRKC